MPAPPTPHPPHRLPWIVASDFNGFFGLVVDNLSILGFIAMALISFFGFPTEVVYTRLFPGTALGVLIGNLLSTWLARRLARRSGKHDITAMPLGLDAPTSIGMAMLVLGPSFITFQQHGMEDTAAAMASWQLGMAALVVMGALKLTLAFVGDWIPRLLPRAALLGALGGAALALLGFVPLVETLRHPLVGFTTLGLLLHVLIAKGRLPVRLPGVLVVFMTGIALYYALGLAGFGAPGFAVPTALPMQLVLPWPQLGFVAGLAHIGPYLSLLLPFGLLIAVGGINVSESARAAGDDYRTRDVLLIDATATLLSGLCGGVAQTTAYIGQPAYKQMGARHGYTLLAGLLIGLGGMLGLVAGLVQWLPVAVLAPIIVFVGISITVQAFHATQRPHAPAVALAFLPALAYLMTIKLPGWVPPEHLAQLRSDVSHGLPELAVIVALGNGFIMTAMLWASALVAMIEHALRKAAGLLLLAAFLSAFGVIHSVDPQGGIYLPWHLDGLPAIIAWQFSAAYVTLAIFLAGLSRQRDKTLPKTSL